MQFTQSGQLREQEIRDRGTHRAGDTVNACVSRYDRVPGNLDPLSDLSGIGRAARHCRKITPWAGDARRRESNERKSKNGHGKGVYSLDTRFRWFRGSVCEISSGMERVAARGFPYFGVWRSSCSGTLYENGVTENASVVCEEAKKRRT